MIQLSPLLSAMPHRPIRPTLLASVDSSRFAHALGALVVPRAQAPAVADDAALLPGRQLPSATGKDLPEPAKDADSDDAEEQDAPEDGAAIAFAWFATEPAPVTGPTPGCVPVALVANAPARTPHLPVALADPSAAAPQPETATGMLAAGDTPEVAVPAAPAPSSTRPIARIAMPAAPTVDTLDLAIPKAVLPVPAATTAPTSIMSSEPGDRPERSVDAPTPPAERAVPPLEQPRANQPLSTFAIAVPTSVPLGSALVAVAATVPAAPAPLRRTSAIEPAGLAILTGATEAAQSHAVPATPDLQQNALDTRRQEWLGKMVETIEAMRDAAPVRETRLSLMPEALGKVEVAIRHDGDRLHVHFGTETQAARQLIADAQPRLGELAEARGLKLGQTSFDSTGAGQGNDRNPHAPFASPQSLKPRLTTASEPVGIPDDDRIA